MWVDACDFNSLDVRHAAREGKGLRSLRRAIEHHLPSITTSDRTVLKAFLCDAQAVIAAYKSDVSLMNSRRSLAQPRES